MREVKWQERRGDSTYLHLNSRDLGVPLVVEAEGMALAHAVREADMRTALVARKAIAAEPPQRVPHS